MDIPETMATLINVRENCRGNQKWTIQRQWLPLQFYLAFIYVAIVSGLSILDFLYSFLSCLFMLPLSRMENPETMAA
jgi:hypothetical protein